jgi:hypothetical protein
MAIIKTTYNPFLNVNFTTLMVLLVLMLFLWSTVIQKNYITTVGIVW